MKKVLVLGHKGMLGNVVYKYLSLQGAYTLVTIPSRWGDASFEGDIRKLNADFIINCIGAIPQKKPTEETYRKVNIELPSFLETLGIKIIHPSTDCEFKGTIGKGELYKKTDIRDADDVYGKSKAEISERIEKEFKNTKIIRTSIIGHEEHSSLALLDWFLSQEVSVKGYSNHYWNGITTLAWVKIAEEMMNHWDSYSALNQYATSPVLSKYEILLLAKEVYGKDIEIIPFATEITVNKALVSDKALLSLREQLIELKEFYGR